VGEVRIDGGRGAPRGTVGVFAHDCAHYRLTGSAG
jgi:hypothetical protein